MEGQLASPSGTITFNPDNPAESDFSVQIPINSIDMDNKKRDQHLLNEDYFDESSYPTIQFKSTSVRQNGSQSILSGTLTIRNITQDVEIPFTIQAIDQNSLKFQGDLTIDRLDYEVGSSSWVLSDEVIIEITVFVQAN